MADPTDAREHAERAVISAAAVVDDLTERLREAIDARVRSWVDAQAAGVTQARIAELSAMSLAGVKMAISAARQRGVIPPATD